jgi:hyperosmotically inducible protein
MKRNKGTIVLLALIVLLFTLGACQTPAGRSTGAVVDDSTITTKIKSKLLADDRVSGMAIDVDTFQGVVTLTGAVDTPQSKEAATQIARNVEGVREVKNMLNIKKK